MQPYEDLFTAVMTATDHSDNNRPLHIMFQLKPSKKVRLESKRFSLKEDQNKLWFNAFVARSTRCNESSSINFNHSRPSLEQTLSLNRQHILAFATTIEQKVLTV